jgi:integrase
MGGLTMSLTSRNIAKISAPKVGNKLHFDSGTGKVGGLALRITAAGAQSFVLCYRTKAGTQRRYTIGDAATWGLAAARDRAKELKRDIDRGSDPVTAKNTVRNAPTVAELCERFLEDHVSRKRPLTQQEYRTIVKNYILPALGSVKVADVTTENIEALHRKLSKDTPYQANRVLAILSILFQLACKWKLRTDNPTKHIERNPEPHRERYLTPEELARLAKALDEHRDRPAANIIGLLLLTGARRGEVFSMRWADVDLTAGVWTKPPASTKQKKTHRVPLNGPALQLLQRLHAQRDKDAEHVFPSARNGNHRATIRRPWDEIRKAAGLKNFRLHDLRHSYASILASTGHSLPMIGALLGHSQAATTHRYSHLLDAPLRAATERAGEIISGK